MKHFNLLSIKNFLKFIFKLSKITKNLLKHHSENPRNVIFHIETISFAVLSQGILLLENINKLRMIKKIGLYVCRNANS